MKAVLGQKSELSLFVNHVVILYNDFNMKTDIMYIRDRYDLEMSWGLEMENEQMICKWFFPNGFLLLNCDANDNSACY